MNGIFTWTAGASNTFAEKNWNIFIPPNKVSFRLAFRSLPANYSGGTPRMAAMDPPEKVVNAIIWSSLHRRKEVQVGWKAKFSYVFHHLMPHFSERFTANVAHKYQIENAPPAPNTDGSLFKPMPTGTGVDDGVRERMKKEDEERKAKQKP